MHRESNKDFKSASIVYRQVRILKEQQNEPEKSQEASVIIILRSLWGCETSGNVGEELQRSMMESPSWPLPHTFLPSFLMT